MKIKEDFEMVNLDSTAVLIPVNDNTFKGVLKLNRSAAFIVGCLAEETTFEEIFNKMKNKYDAPEDKLSAAINQTLEQLRSIGALCE